MDDPSRSGRGRDWRLILAAVLLALVLGGIAYHYADDLTAFVASLTSGKMGRPRGHIRY
jgi:hypothetical protein